MSVFPRARIWVYIFLFSILFLKEGFSQAPQNREGMATGLRESAQVEDSSRFLTGAPAPTSRPAASQDSSFRMQSSVARFYNDGIEAMKRGERMAALAAFRSAHKLDQDYRDVASLLAELEEELRLHHPPEAPARNLQISASALDSLYQTALTAMAREEWALAVASLERLETLQPHNQEIKERLMKTRAFLMMANTEMARVEVGNQRRVLTYVCTLTLLAVTVLAVYFAVSPGARARLLFLRGRHQQAAELYERLLLQHPDRVKYYAPLAGIYLLAGRADENAMKVYRTVLDLNLSTPHREALNAVLVKTSLSQGTTDAESIKALEMALQEEYRKQNRK